MPDCMNPRMPRGSAVRGVFRAAASIAPVLVAILMAAPAEAACDATAPAGSTTVTCDANAPNPETDAIIAPGSTDVEVDFEPNAALQTATSPAINLGGGALIYMMSGSMIADFDPSTVPVTIQGVLDGDFTGVTDQVTLDALFDSIQTEVPVGATPAGATIELGVTDSTATDTSIHETTAKVTVNKAMMTDLAMNAITDYISGPGDVTARVPSAAATLTPPASAGGPNTVFVDGGTVISGGAAAIRSAGDSALDVTVTGGGTIASLTENAPAVLLDGVGGLHVDLEDGSIATFFDGSAGVALPFDGSAMSVIMAGDSHILTAGDGSAAILGPGANSVFNLEVSRPATDAVPTIATFGDNSAGIYVHGATGSTATLQFIGAGPGTNPAFQTGGVNSTLIDMDLGGNSSISLTGENTSFGTFGDGSGVMSLLTGSSSDTLVYLLDSTLTSAGADATLLETSRDEDALTQLVAIGDTFTATGDRSAGIVYRNTGGGASSSNSFFIGTDTVSTAGDDAPAFLVEAGGEFSVRTVTVGYSSFTTLGANSAGFFVGGLGDSSALDVSATSTTIDTTGANSPGLFVGGIGTGSAMTTSFANGLSTNYFDITTRGDNSNALTVMGVANDNSVSSFVMNNATLSTQGANSIGLFAPMLRGTGSDSTGVADWDSTTISTMGAGSTGMIVGDASNHSGSAPNIFDTSISVSGDHTTIDTAGDGAAGFLLYGLGDGMSSSDATASFDNFDVTTQGNDARGVVLDFFGQDMSGSSETLAFDHFTIDTAGDRSTGLIVGDGEGANTGIDGSDITVAFDHTTINTAGDDAIGLIIEPIGPGATDSTFSVTMDNVTVTTSGANAHGIVLGEGLGADMSATNTDNSLYMGTISSTTTGDGAAALVLNGHTSIAPVAGAFSASGANAHAVLGQLDAGETTAITITDSSSATATGAGGSGMVFEGTGAGASAMVTVQSGGTVSGADMALSFDNVQGSVDNAGTLNGDSGIAAAFGATADSFVNSGSVTGDVLLGDGLDTAELVAGQSITGVIDGQGGSGDFLSFTGTGTSSIDMGDVLGFENFQKAGTSTWTLTGTNAVAAPFLVSGGTLANNAVLQNMLMTVGPDGRLQGNGTLGGLTINGTVAPGNSIGTINVAGNVVFNTGSTYEVEIAAPDQADLISATGTATINGGALQIVKLDPDASYADGQTYRIVEADGGVVHNADFTSNQPFSLLRTDVVYGADYVDLTLIANVPFNTWRIPTTGSSRRPDCRTSRRAATRSPSTTRSCSSLASAGWRGAVRQAFDLSSGEIHASGQHIIRSGARTFTRMLQQQAEAALGEGGRGVKTETVALGYASARTRKLDMMSAVARDLDGKPENETFRGAFIAPLATSGSIAGDGNAATINWRSAGVIGGYEGPVDVVFGRATVGFAAGYLHSSGTVDARLSTLTSDGFHFGAYGAWTDGTYVATGALAFGAADVHTSRRVMFGGIDRTAEASYWAQTVDLEAEVSRPFDIGDDTRLAPLATLSAGWMGHGATTETGAGSLNLAVASENQGWFDTGLGVSLSRRFVAANGIDGMVEARLVWEHGFGSTVPRQGLAFAGSPTAFSVAGPDQGSDRLRLGLSLGVKVGPRADFRASYDGMFSAAAQDHRANVGLRVHF